MGVARAVELWPEHALALYGLGQMYIHKAEADKAVPLFEKVLAAYPDNIDVMKVLGSLYSHMPDEERQKKACFFVRVHTRTALISVCHAHILTPFICVY